MWPFLVAATLAAQAAPAPGGLRVATFACEIGGDRTNVLPQQAELKSDDELECKVTLQGVPAGRFSSLAGELRIPLVRGGVRSVASGKFKRVRDAPGKAELEGLFVPHSTWAPAVEWQTATRPRLPLVIYIFGEVPRAAKRLRWRLLLTKRIELDHRPQRRR